MELIKIIHDADIFPRSAPSELEENYDTRIAARAVLFDKKENIAILHVGNYGYYKLPGGGMEEGEDVLTALKREVLEEVGCDIEVKGEIGKIIEFRDKFHIKQESFCYLAEVSGEKGRPKFTQEEINDGFDVRWVSISNAIMLIRDSEPKQYQGHFIKIRDLCFLEWYIKNI